jgi:hypothetical protein
MWTFIVAKIKSKHMKTNHLLLSFVAVYLLFQSTSCKTITENDLNAEVAKLGIIVTDNIVLDSRNIQNTERYFKFNRSYVGILNSQSKDSLAIADSSNKSTSELLVAMVALNKVYQSYFLFADKGIVPEETKFSENVKAVVEILELILPDEKEKLKKIKEAAGSRRFDEKGIMFQISSLFLKYTDKEFGIQKQKFAKIASDYENQIHRIPATAFDPQKLASLVSEPVKGDNLLIEVYKLQLISDASNKVEDLNHSMDLALDALNLLNRMHGEFLKKKPDRDAVESMIIRAQNIYPVLEKSE